MKPNLFSFATSELTQDAVIAYLLAWSSPDCARENELLHQLGTNFLYSLMDVSSKSKNVDNPLKYLKINKIKVGRQLKHIDVHVEINDEYFLLIEDKVHTYEHSNQINRYVLELSEIKSVSESNIYPVYIKTGDESLYFQPKSNIGIYGRGDFLSLIGRFSDTKNTIIEDFREHLQRWESRIEIFQSTPVKSWGWDEFHGFYKALECCFNAAGYHNDYSWKYVSNPAGGFLGYFWHFTALKNKSCSLYLQIENAKELKIRACAARNPDGSETSITSPMQYKCLELISQELKKLENINKIISVVKYPKFKGGSYAGVASVLFDGQWQWIATDVNNIIDWKETMRRVDQVMQLITSAAEAAGT